MLFFSANYWTWRYLFESYLQCKMYQNFMTKILVTRKRNQFFFLCISNLGTIGFNFGGGVTDCIVMQLSFLEKRKKKKDFVKKYSTELKFVYLENLHKMKTRFLKKIVILGGKNHDRKCLVSSCGTNKSAIKSWPAKVFLKI